MFDFYWGGTVWICPWSFWQFGERTGATYSTVFFSTLYRYLFKKNDGIRPSPPKVVQKRQVYVAEIVVRHTKRRTYRWSHGSLGRGSPQVEASCLALQAAGLDVFFLCVLFGEAMMGWWPFLMGLMMGWWWVFGVDEVQLVVFMGGLGRLVVLGFLGYPLWKGIVA